MSFEQTLGLESPRAMKLRRRKSFHLIVLSKSSKNKVERK